MTEAPTPTEKSKKQRENIKRQQKLQFHNDLGRSVWVKVIAKLILLKRLTGFQPSHLSQNLCNRRHEHVGIILQLAEISICIVSKEICNIFYVK